MRVAAREPADGRTRAHRAPAAPDPGPGGAPAGSATYGRNILVTFLGGAFPALAALATAPILAHALGVESRGQVAAAMGTYLLATAVATLGVPEAVTFAIARSSRGVRAITVRGLALLAGVGAVAMAALVVMSGWLSAGQASTGRLIVLASVAIVPALCLGVVRGAAAGLHQFGLIARERAISAAVRLAAVAALAAGGQLTPRAATLVLAIAPVVGAVAYWSLRHAMRRPSPEGAHRPERVPLGFALRLWVGSVSGVVLSRADQALLTPLAGSYELGLYVVAVTISEVPLVVNSAIRDVTFATEASDRSSERLTAAARLSGVTCAAVGLVLAACAPFALPVLFGDDFAPALGATLLLIAAVVMGTPGSVAGAGLSARGHPGLRSAALILACTLNIGLLVLLAPQYGAVGAAWATVAGNLVHSHLNIVFLRVTGGVPVRDFYLVRRSDLDLLAGLARRLLARRG